jgi:hypothetical protein
MGLGKRETFVPQVWGGEAQVDWYEAMVDLAGERWTVYIFAMRSMASGGAVHVAYFHATQQAFPGGARGGLWLLRGSLSIAATT